MSVLVDEKYAEILIRQRDKLVEEVNDAISIMETNGHKSPMLDILKKCSNKNT